MPGRRFLKKRSFALILLCAGSAIPASDAGAGTGARSLRALAVELSSASGLGESQVTRRILSRYNSSWRIRQGLPEARSWDDLLRIEAAERAVGRGLLSSIRGDTRLVESLGLRAGAAESSTRSFARSRELFTADPDMRWQSTLERAERHLPESARASFRADLSRWHLPFRSNPAALRSLERMAAAEAEIRGASGRPLIGSACASLESPAALQNLAAVAEAGAARIRVHGAPATADEWAGLIDSSYASVFPKLGRARRSVRICGLIRACAIFGAQYGSYFCGAGR